VLTSLLLAGRVGSGMASELASMAVTPQPVDAYPRARDQPRQLPGAPAHRRLPGGVPRPDPLRRLRRPRLRDAGQPRGVRHDAEYYYSKTVEVVTLTDSDDRRRQGGDLRGSSSGWPLLEGPERERGHARGRPGETWVVVVSSVLILNGRPRLSKLLILLGVIQ
jgi:hypothetical protein